VSEEFMGRRKQKTQLQSIGDVLFPLLKKRGMASRIEDNAIRKLWPKAVGPKIAAQTKPDSLRNGTLFVKTVSSVWVQQLHFMREEILTKINNLLTKPVIKEIRFVVGYDQVQGKNKEHESVFKKTVLKKRDREMIAECTDALTDRELASVLKKVMQLEISRRRQWENGKDH